jgi:hypothetical protein
MRSIRSTLCSKHQNGDQAVPAGLVQLFSTHLFPE